jgi:putative DNA primase/helicase
MATATRVLPIRDFMHTDLGNAERFVAEHGHRLHYVRALEAWLVWDGRRWAADERGAVQRLAKQTIRGMYREAARSTELEHRKRLSGWAAKSESASRIDAMLKLARGEETEAGPILREMTDFDADPWALNVANGIVDLRTGALRPHDPEARCRKLVEVPLQADARCPRWLAFLDRILGGDAEMIDYVQRAVGYSLTGLGDEQCLFFLYGHGANGKSTFIETLRKLLGGYAAHADFNTLVERRGEGPRTDIARLERTRFVSAIELSEGKRLNEELVKSLTGGEPVTVRFLYGREFEFRPEFKLWLAANHRPVIRGTDHGIWRRIRLVPFEVQIPDAEQIPEREMRAALDAELPGILAWALDGCLAWQRKPLWPPPKVAQATQAYREESDVLGAWIDESCSVDKSEIAEKPPEHMYYKAQASLLYQNYRRWAQDNGEYVLSQNAFGRRLAERGHPDRKMGTGSSRVIWRLGIRLKDTALAGSRD